MCLLVQFIVQLCEILAHEHMFFASIKQAFIFISAVLRFSSKAVEHLHVQNKITSLVFFSTSFAQTYVVHTCCDLHLRNIRCRTCNSHPSNDYCRRRCSSPYRLHSRRQLFLSTQNVRTNVTMHRSMDIDLF